MRKFCGHRRKVIFVTELDAKMALARRVWKDKGEKRYYECRFGGKLHWHLTSEEKRNASSG